MPNKEVKQELTEFEETGRYIPPTDGSEPVVSGSNDTGGQSEDTLSTDTA